MRICETLGEDLRGLCEDLRDFGEDLDFGRGLQGETLGEDLQGFVTLWERICEDS